MDMGGVQRGFVRAKGPGGSHLTMDRLLASLAVNVGGECGSDGCRRWRWPRGGIGAHCLEHRVELLALHICQVRRGRQISVRKGRDHEKQCAGINWRAWQRRTLKYTRATAAIATSLDDKFCDCFTQVRCRDFIFWLRAHSMCVW